MSDNADPRLKDVSSRLVLTPTRDDNQANYACAPQHPALQSPTAMQASAVLDILCKYNI